MTDSSPKFATGDFLNDPETPDEVHRVTAVGTKNYLYVDQYGNEKTDPFIWVEDTYQKIDPRFISGFTYILKTGEGSPFKVHHANEIGAIGYLQPSGTPYLALHTYYSAWESVSE